ncbi:hypothetical protein BJI67_01320 [Acidihalobacter aeolianus]|uniref:TonB-dependent receptor n=1 Tax=Acidihalobacter aeolianus TaxID=2792603 RepID=A0A1D8K4J9_9GAMM|nr:TonB-dependent receptor [Acidihalobacter aeolianus]AOV15891.1 hypothetical protein BJI67_01320 [Acidihalobacter aeolianus]
MKLRRKHLAHMIHLAAVGGLCLGGGLSVAQAGPLNLGTVSATNGSSKEQQKSAVHQAPSKAPLKATQPTAVISRHYIKHNVQLSENYSSIVQVSPSVATTDPNGPGLMETQFLSMRGLQNGQYNLWIDGIPWGDSNDFTHHSTSYLMANDIGQIDVDRGPGSASTIGDATFGGTIAILTKNPSMTPGITATLAGGSFNTQVEGVQFDTGNMQNYHDTRAFLDIQNLSSDGYLTYSALKRQNYFFKVLRPINDHTMLSFVAMFNKIHQNVPIGATMAEIQKYGWNYGLSNDPTQQNYYGYNYDDIETNMAYIGLKTRFSNGIRLDNKLYTYGYNHHGYNGADPNGETPNGTNIGNALDAQYGTTQYANDVPGQRMTMIYQSVGDLLRVVQPIAIGDLKYGFWYDHQWNTRSQYEIDWTLGGALNIGAGKAGAFGATDRLMYDTLDSAQPYVELDWHITPRMTLTPGVRYAWFKRDLNATVNQGPSTAPVVVSKTWSSAIPSIALHYKLASDWTAYAQAAEGYLAPNLNLFYTADPSTSVNSVKPETTTNFQVGTSYQTHKLALSGDFYYINFNNQVGSRTIAGNKVFFNQGGVIYQGVEGSATVYVGSGFSGYVNGSINSAKTKDTHQWVPNAPKATAVIGVIYNRGPAYGSLLDKYVGSSYGDTGETQPINAYSVASLALGYKLNAGLAHPVDVSLKVDNLLDKKTIINLAGYTGGANTPLYWTLASRSLEVSVSSKF